MALSTDDLFRLEAKARMHADALRREIAAQPGVGPAMKMVDDAMMADAKAYDAIGDLLLGLQGCWDHHDGAQIVRDGFKRMSRPFDKSKTYVLAIEAKAAATKAEEAAA